MQISQTRTKWQTQSLAGCVPAVLCVLLSQARVANAVSPFAISYCMALFLQQKKGYTACLGCVVGALLQYPAVPMATALIPAGLFVVAGLGEIYRQRTGRALVLGTAAAVGLMCFWLFERDTVFSMATGLMNLALVFPFALLFEEACQCKEAYKRKGALDDTQKLALAVLASGLLMGCGGWLFCGLSVYVCLGVMLSVYGAWYLPASLAASVGLWTGFCGVLCGAMEPVVLAGFALAAFAAGFGSRVNHALGTVSYLLCFGTFLFLTRQPQLGVWLIELGAGLVLAYALPHKLGEKLAFGQKQKKSREEKPRLELVQQTLTKQLVCLSEALSLTGRLMQETQDRQNQAGGLELQMAAQVLRQSARQSRRGWFDSSSERLIKQRLVQKGLDVTGVAVQRGREKSVRVEINQCSGVKGCRLSMEKLISSVCQEPMELESQACAGQGRGHCCLQFVRKNELNVEGGVATAKKKGQQVNGDVFSALHLGKGQELICLCDGMGSGTTAAETAQIASKLIELFFEAGFDQNQVIPMVNRILSMRTKEVFAAVDLCLVDLVQGHCQMVKTGAAPSWIIRNGIAESITAPALPIGIVDHVRPGVIERSIEPGDTIVLLSDGIADLMTPEELPDWLGQVERAQSAAEAAEALLAMARARAEGRDDMTAVVLRMQGRRR